MQYYRKLRDIQLEKSSCAIGMFDGVHLGHRVVLQSALDEAKKNKLTSVVFSFANHPQFLLSKTPPTMLSTLTQRLAYFKQLGFDVALILDFDDTLKKMPAQTFVDNILLKHLGIQSVSVGYDHCFGAHRQGDTHFLSHAAALQNFNALIIPPFRINEQIVSSTIIRKLLLFGQLKQANSLLGRPYTLSGIVEKGLQRGRTLGFPTANLQTEPYQLIPATGTYLGWAQLKQDNAPAKLFKALCNIGYSPTFGDQPQRRVEVYLLDYHGDAFYGHTLTMSFEQKLRNEQAFDSADTLVAQLKHDLKTAQTTHLQEPCFIER